ATGCSPRVPCPSAVAPDPGPPGSITRLELRENGPGWAVESALAVEHPDGQQQALFLNGWTGDRKQNHPRLGRLDRRLVIAQQVDHLAQRLSALDHLARRDTAQEDALMF